MLIVGAIAVGVAVYNTFRSNKKFRATKAMPATIPVQIPT